MLFVADSVTIRDVIVTLCAITIRLQHSIVRHRVEKKRCFSQIKINENSDRNKSLMTCVEVINNKCPKRDKDCFCLRLSWHSVLCHVYHSIAGRVREKLNVVILASCWQQQTDNVGLYSPTTRTNKNDKSDNNSRGPRRHTQRAWPVLSYEYN